MGHESIEVGTVVFRLGATIFFVLLNGFFVAAEFALVKVRATRIRGLSRQGNKRAKKVEHVLDHLDLYLSACQLGITVASLILGWLAEPAVAELLLAGARAVGWGLEDGALVHAVALAIALTIVTILHMTLGEQAPKIWAIKNPEVGALRSVYPLRGFTLVLRPLIWLINRMSNALLRLIGVGAGMHDEGSPSPEELREILAGSAAAGHITRRQREFAENIISFIDLEVRHILVPRVEVVFLSLEKSREENLEIIATSGHSRFPVCTSDLDSVIGMVHTKDLLKATLENRSDDLSELARKVPFVPDSQPLGRLIVELQRARTECAVVLDEWGTALGLVFLEDALEEIVGPIQDEFDVEDEQQELTELSPGVWDVRGDLPLPDAISALGIDASDEHDTIGGLVISALGRLPKKDDEISLGAFRIKVIEVRRWRVVKLRVERVEAAAEEETQPR